jgi:hypothetical protein
VTALSVFSLDMGTQWRPFLHVRYPFMLFISPFADKTV